MTIKRILFFGGSGQIGQAFKAETKPKDWEIIAPTSSSCDITSTNALRTLMQLTKPDLVINSAAMTNVDACEKEHDRARAINFEAVATMVAQCSALDVPLIHLSTDYVFDGRDGAHPYMPDSPMNPLNAYGETKMLGEEAIRHDFPWHVILRVSSVFSAYSSNILTNILKSIDVGSEINVPSNQLSTPTYAPDVTQALVIIGDAILHGKSNGFGTFHLSGDHPAPRQQFAQAIMDAYAPHTSHRPSIIPVDRSKVAGIAPRPAYSVLDCVKIATVYDIKPKSWRDGVTKSVAAYVTNKSSAA